MALEAPSWLNVGFMEKILRKSENDNSIHVTDIFTKPATAKGDNYASDMIRVTTEFTREHCNRKISGKKSIVLKLAPMEEGVRKDMILNSKIFDTEISMMTNTLRRMNELLGPEHYLSARALYTQRKNPILLAIEDLTPLGFRMADRQAGLDLAHALLAIRGLARFHASSIAVCEEDPTQKSIYSKGIFSTEQPPEVSTFFILGTKALANEVENWPELGPRYAEKIMKISDHLYQKGVEVVKRCDDDFNVINHGDVWVNNMLFRYDENGKPIGHIFVDFQMSYYGSPAIDLLYFLDTSPSNEVIESSKHVLLEEYLLTLSATMKKVGCKKSPPTMDQLKKALRDKAMYGMIASFTVLPIVLIDKADAKSLDEMMSKDGTYENNSYKGKQYRKVMVKRIPMYDEMGLLDL